MRSGFPEESEADAATSGIDLNPHNRLGFLGTATTMAAAATTAATATTTTTTTLLHSGLPAPATRPSAGRFLAAVLPSANPDTDADVGLSNSSWSLWELASTAASAALQPQLGFHGDFDGDGSGLGGLGDDDILGFANSSGNFSLVGPSAVTETPYVPYVLRPETYIVPVLFAFIFIVGVLGNGTLIVVFLSVRQMRNVPNTYILSLALADLLVIVTTVPLTSTVYTVDSWPWGSFLCTLSEFIKDVSIGVSVFTLTALSADRYFAIVDPLRKFHAHGGGKRATRMTIAIAVSIWILAIICGLPALLGSCIKRVDINSNKSFSYCYPFPDRWGPQYAKVMVLLRFLVYYAIPLIIIGVFYVLIARHLMFTASVPGEMQGAVRQVRARRKVAVTVLAFVLIFGICFLPYHVFMLWFYYWPTAQADYNTFWHVLRILGFCLSFANSCANPVALYFVSGAFRKHFNRYLFCQGAGVRHKKRGDTMCMHRDTSLTSTASKRYHSRRSLHHQSTIRSRLHETTITVLPNGIHNGFGNGAMAASMATPTSQAGPATTTTASASATDAAEVPLTSDYCQYPAHERQLM